MENLSQKWQSCGVKETSATFRWYHLLVRNKGCIRSKLPECSALEIFYCACCAVARQLI